MNRTLALAVCGGVWLGGGWLASALAREGYVETRTGGIYEGQIRFESNAVIVASAARELWVRLPATNLAGITFLAELAPRPAIAEAAARTDATGPWHSEDVGSVRWPGGVEERPGMFRVWSAGTNVMADSDSFHFVFRRVRGPSQMIARVTAVGPTDPWARAGLMMRDGLAADARHVFLSLTAARGGVLQWRERKGEETNVRLAQGWGVPSWLKLKRDGSTVTAYRSSNGQQWSEIERVSLPAIEELCVGLAVASVREQSMNESVFENVEEGVWLPNRGFIPEIELRSCSVLRGGVEAMDDATIRLAGRPQRPAISRKVVANIRFQPLPRGAGHWLNSGRSGVMLSSGEFIDGDCREIAHGSVLLSSIPLGLCRYDLSTEVSAIVLARRGDAARQPCEVTTVDRSTWVGSEVTLHPDGLNLREPSLGVRRIPLHDLLELRRRL